MAGSWHRRGFAEYFPPFRHYRNQAGFFSHAKTKYGDKTFRVVVEQPMGHFIEIDSRCFYLCRRESLVENILKGLGKHWLEPR